MLHRQGHQIFPGTQVLGCQFREGLGDSLEDLPVGLRLPARAHRLGKRVDERVHVRGVEVVLLIPGGGGQDDVGVRSGGVEAEIDVHHQVQLGGWSFLVPLHFLAVVAVAAFLQHAVLRAEQVLQKILVPLGRGADQVGAPDDQVSRPVNRVVRVGERHVQRSGLELAGDVLGRARLVGGAGLDGFGGQFDRVAVEVRRRGQPAHAGSGDVVVGQAVALVAIATGRREQVIGLDRLVAPLVGMEVPVGGRVHLPWRAVPVQAEGDRRPAGLRAQLFLAHVMCPAATRLAHAAAQVQQIHDRAVGQVVVVPVVDRRTHDDHGFAMSLGGVVGELTAGAGQIGALHAGYLLGPGRGVGDIGVIVGSGDVLAAQAPVDTVLGDLQVEHRGDEGCCSVSQRDPAHRHVAPEEIGLALGEVGEAHRDDFHAVLALARQFGAHVGAVGFLLQQIPFPYVFCTLGPAEADRAVGHHEGAGHFVPDDGLPLRVVALVHAAQVGGAQVAVADISVGNPSVFMGAQDHLHGQVGVFAGVFLEIGDLFVDVELA